MSIEKLKYITYLILSTFGIGLLIYMFFKYVFLLILPFLIGFAIASATAPISGYVSNKSGINKRFLRVFFTLIFMGATIAVTSFSLWQLSLEIWKFFEGMGEDNGVLRFISDLVSHGGSGGIFSNFSKELGDIINSLLVSFATSLGKIFSTFIKTLPKAFLFVLVTVISSVYFAFDFERIKSILKSIVPKRFHKTALKLKINIQNFIKHYVKSYLILMGVTFSIMLLGLIILHAPYAFLFSLIIAILDLLPIIGVGTILVPASVVFFINGNNFFGIGLLVMFLVNEIVREFLEPKLLGSKYGIPPVVTLLLLYIGYSLFSFVGLLFVPIGTVILSFVIQKKNTSNVEQLRT